MFPDRVFLKKGGYYLVLSLPGYAGPRSLTVWAGEAQLNTGSFLEVNGAKTDSSLMWQMGYFQKTNPSLLDKKWAVIDLEKNIIVLENKRTEGSAYFVKDLNASNDQIDYSGLDLRRVSVDRIDIENSERSQGWIVLPMRIDSGWKAFVNGRLVKYDAYLGLLPAIPVNGPGQLIFKYEPESFWKGLIVSMTGVLIFLVFSGFCLRIGKKT
jgi:hypothetical protein